MTINEEALDYVFCYTINCENVAEALTKLTKEEYINKKQKFIKKYGIKISRDTIKENQIQNEIKKGIKYVTARDNQTSIF